MKNKSLWISLAVSVFAFALFAWFSRASLSQSPAVSSPAAAPGRFQITTSAGYVFVLDTATGQVWEKFVSVSGGDTSSGFNEPKAGPGSGH